MKILTVVRHTKAEKPDGFATDQDRPLSERGQRDARRMGKVLSRLKTEVSWWISSPAQRTRQTTEIMGEASSYSGNILWEAAVYEANAETLLDLLAATPAEMVHVVLVGHNPGMETLVSGLVTGTPGRLSVHMPPGALAHLNLEVFQWNQIRWGCGRLELLATPKVFKK